ncbi:DUF6794 domain-containing protein [Flavobacterium daemonense]|uniref:DUF6794 domain-containing protein n=1 Tax=Flavobacterium daemonense TaxID=1393049 RepID=UPI0011859585|nr:DUF6794 domain-containing protein [Flavobacterium daemonense]KAF2328189.1 hypothetical protein FND99_17745 [Flavobacterium daemonense]
MKKQIYLLFTFLIYLTSCSQNLPSNLDESLNYFEKNWTENSKNSFKNKPENDAVTELHTTVGMWIRNNWIRHGNGKLVKQFNKIGIYHPDDISSIILTSLHRKLNHQDLKVEEQAQHYIDYWKPILENDEKSKKIAFDNYNKYKVGDKINIYYPVLTHDGKSNAVIYENNKNWIYNAKTDLKVTGIIKAKYFINSETNVFFKIEITEKSKENIKVLMQEMKIGNLYNFQLDKLTID